MNEQQDVFCPYCNAKLEKRPTRKKKCPHCSRPIFVKSTPDNREKRLMTEEQANEAEKQWTRYHELNELRRIAAQFGLPEYRAESMTKKDILEYAIKVGSPSQKKMAFHRLAIDAERDGKDFLEYIRMQKFWELHEIKESGFVEKVEIVVGGPHPCAACKSASGTVLTIEDALEKMPLPHSACTNTMVGDRQGFCNCRYEPYFDDDF